MRLHHPRENPLNDGNTIVDLESNNNYDSHNSKSNSSSKCSRLLIRMNLVLKRDFKKILAIQFAFTFLLLLTMPAHIRTKNNKLINESLTQLSAKVYEQKQALSGEVGDLTAVIYSDNQKLIDALGDKIGMISKERLEKEVGKIKDENEKQGKEKQNEIVKLQEAIIQNKKELEQVKKQIDLNKETEKAVQAAELANRAEKKRLAEEATKKAEVERIEGEKKAEENKLAAEEAAKKAEVERVAAAKKAEEDKLSAEETAKKAEVERVAAEKKTEEDRLAAEETAKKLVVEKAEDESGAQEMIPEKSCPEGEALYLKQYPVVGDAINAKTFESAFDHWKKHGQQEGKKYIC